MQCRGAKSFADDLGLSRGVVLSRAAASLRSIETKPFDWKICPHRTDTSSEEQKVSLGLRRCTVVLPAKLSERGAPFTRGGWMELSLKTLFKETSNKFVVTRGRSDFTSFKPGHFPSRAAATATHFVVGVWFISMLPAQYTPAVNTPVRGVKHCFSRKQSIPRHALTVSDESTK